MKLIGFVDVLNREIEMCTKISLEKQMKDEPCWIICSRVVGKTDWDTHHLYENKYFATEEKAFKEILERVNRYKKTSEKVGKEFKITSGEEYFNGKNSGRKNGKENYMFKE